MKPICRNFTTSHTWREQCRLGYVAWLDCGSCSAYDPDTTERKDRDVEGWGELMGRFEPRVE
jgi:hypothetical protein